VLTGAHLGGADLRYASLRYAEVREADLTGANLRFAVLAGADLREADLTGADLGFADLEGADLTDVRLERAEVGNACLIDATIDDADLVGAVDVGKAIRRKGDPGPFVFTLPSVVTTEPQPGHLSGMFACQREGCTAAAGWVTLVAKEAAPDGGEPLFHGGSSDLAPFGKVLVGGFMSMNNSFGVTSDRVLAQIAAGLRAGDVLTLAEESEDYAPFYCSSCRAVYCAEHCQLEEVRDPDWGVTPDYWKGTCPNGHPVFVDH
jgi:Pentapeptide repeats (8 copies)